MKLYHPAMAVFGTICSCKRFQKTFATSKNIIERFFSFVKCFLKNVEIP